MLKMKGQWVLPLNEQTHPTDQVMKAISQRFLNQKLICC